MKTRIQETTDDNGNPLWLLWSGQFIALELEGTFETKADAQKAARQLIAAVKGAAKQEGSK